MSQAGARSASRPKTSSLSRYEELMCKCAVDATLRLTELSASWRSMDSVFLLRKVEDLEASAGGIAESMQRIALALETVETTLVDLNHRQWLPHPNLRAERECPLP